jgi:anti-anti-sigma factor
MSEGDLQITVRPGSAANSTIISLDGPLTQHSVPQLQQAWRQTENDIIFHLAGVPVADSSGIGCLVNALITCQRTGRRLALADVSRRLHQMLSVPRVDALFSIYPTLELAEKAFTGHAAAAK